MAMSTPTFSSCSDSTLQYLSSPFHGDQYEASSHFPFVDMGLINPVPPALLSSEAINFPPAYSQTEQYQMAPSGGMSQSVSTPVMHPNLVSTLKSMISPSPSSSDQSGKASGGSEGSSDERKGGFRRTTDRCKRKHGLLQQHLELPDMYSLSSPSGGMYDDNSHHAGEAEDDEAAVVPVDLILNCRPFKCAYPGCNKTFKNPQTMKMHHKTHYSDDSAFRLGINAHALSTSKAGRNKKIPARCPACWNTFVGMYELRRHFGRKHSEGERSYGCKKCNKKFWIVVDLRDHEKLCGQPIECKCGMKFAFKCNLVAHKKGHPECQDQSYSQDEQSDAVVRRSPSSSSSRRNASDSSMVAGRSLHFSSISPPATPPATPPRRSCSQSRRNASASPVVAGRSVHFSRSSSSSRRNASASPIVAHLSRISPPATLSHLASPWGSPMSSSQELSGPWSSPLSSSQELSGPWSSHLAPSQEFSGLAACSGDGMSVSSDSSHQPVVSSASVTALSSRSSPGILRPSFLV